MADLQRAFLSLPPVTRTILAGTTAVTLPCLLALVSPYRIVFIWSAIRHRFELWRLVTPFFYAGSGLSAIFNVFFLFRTCNDLETGVYRGRTHDLAWALTCMATGIVVLSYPLKSVIFFRAALLAMTHLWAQFSPEQPMNLYGFITIPAKYLAYALLGLDLLQGGPAALMEGLTGIISAHVFHYLTEVYPRANPGAKRVLDTPAWFARLFGVNLANQPARTERSLGGGVTRIDPPRRQQQAGGGGSASRSSGSSTATATTGSAAARSGGYNWGSGNRLGTE